METGCLLFVSVFGDLHSLVADTRVVAGVTHGGEQNISSFVSERNGLVLADASMGCGYCCLVFEKCSELRGGGSWLHSLEAELTMLLENGKLTGVWSSSFLLLIIGELLQCFDGSGSEFKGKELAESNLDWSEICCFLSVLSECLMSVDC